MFDLGRTLVAAVERDPNALAIVDGDTRLTYGQWFDRILNLAGGLDDLGLAKGDRLAAVMQNRWEMASLHWACQLAGIVVVPLNWRATGNELDPLLADSAASAVAFEASTEAAIADAPATCAMARIAVGGATGGSVAFERLLTAPPLAGTCRATAEDLSLMLYTSGTTGLGKGVPRRHRAERAAGIAHVAQNQYGYGERTLGVMPLYHTMGVRSLIAMALINGAFICLPKFDSAGALGLIEREAVTNLYLVPTLYHDLLADPAFARTDVSRVRKLGFAGATMTDGLLGRLDQAFRPDLFVNHYGSSEIYTFTICPQAHRKPGSAGKAGLNQRIRVVALAGRDPNARTAPNQEGEIIAALDGDEAFEGYWRRPEADTKALRDGWYFTGDTGYVDQDGDLFVTGRVDDMIISGGENITPAEVESAVSLHPAVAEVAVAGLPDPRWGQSVTAFVTRRATVSAAALDAHCRGSALADFKRPRAYVFVTEIPKSPVGKVLRRKLVAGDYTLAETASPDDGAESD